MDMACVCEICGHRVLHDEGFPDKGQQEAFCDLIHNLRFLFTVQNDNKQPVLNKKSYNPEIVFAYIYIYYQCVKNKNGGS